VAKSFSSKNNWFSGSETGIFLKIQWKKEKKIRAAKNADFRADFWFSSWEEKVTSRAEHPSARAMARGSDSSLLFSFGTFDSLLAGLVWAEIKCIVHDAVLKWSINMLNQFIKANNRTKSLLPWYIYCVSEPSKSDI